MTENEETFAEVVRLLKAREHPSGKYWVGRCPKCGFYILLDEKQSTYLCMLCDTYGNIFEKIKSQPIPKRIRPLSNFFWDALCKKNIVS